jgi:hypothetical protein
VAKKYSHTHKHLQQSKSEIKHHPKLKQILFISLIFFNMNEKNNTNNFQRHQIAKEEEEEEEGE